MRISSLDDEYLKLAQEAIDGMNLAALPGKHFVEFFPFLQYIPSWFPGAYSQRLVEQYRPIVDAMLDRPFEKIYEAIVSTAISHLHCL